MTGTDSPLLSIIIPVFNGEKYLRRTLDSITSQCFFDDCEVIAVNDGSRDSSLAILRDFSSRYDNIIIIDKANEGVSVARNRGLDEARGTYCLFIDADDLLHPDALDIILPILSSDTPDILVWNYAPFYSRPRTTHVISPVHENLRGSEAFNILMARGCGVGLWLKAFSRRLISGLGFIPGMTFGEDMFFGWKAMLLADRVIFIDTPLYLYRQTDSNATSRFHPSLYESYASAFDDLRSFASEHGLLDDELQRDLDYHFTRRLPALASMEIKAPYGRPGQLVHLKKALADGHISGALRSDPRLKGHIYDLAREGRVDEILSEARSRARKEKLLFPIKRLIK